MSKDRPYEYVPTIAILLLIEGYQKFIDSGDFKFTKEMELLKEELDRRFLINKEEERKRKWTITN